MLHPYGRAERSCRRERAAAVSEPCNGHEGLALQWAMLLDREAEGVHFTFRTSYLAKAFLGEGGAGGEHASNVNKASYWSHRIERD